MSFFKIKTKNSYYIQLIANFGYSEIQLDTMQKAKDNPTAIRLKDTKAPLQEEAMKLDRSLNWLVYKVLKEFCNTLKKNK